MMRKIYIQIILSLLICFSVRGQEVLRLKLEDVVALSRNQSPQAVAARHQYKASYWNWRSFKADYLPSLSFGGASSLNRSITSVTLPNGSDSFVHRNVLSSEGGITLQQNIALTGGNIFLSSALQRLDNFSEKRVDYSSTPLIIGFRQNIFGYNGLKWNRKIEPIRYTQAEKRYVETLELVSSLASVKFFQLALAQSNLQTAVNNYAISDTLYQYAKGRYNIGTITENEMLQLEINHLSEQTNKLNAQIEVDDRMQDLRSYLGLAENTSIEVNVSDTLSAFVVPMEDALRLAHENSPDVDELKLQKLVSESNVANAKSAGSLKADLYVEFGLTQTNARLQKTYTNPIDKELIKLGISIPILDWGVNKGRVEVAKSNLEKAKIDIKQAQIDFDANVIKLVKQFNLQPNKVSIAKKTAQRAQRRHEVAYKLYLLGKSTILDLNAATAEKDNLQRAYINELRSYWSMYYTLRSITGYDFENRSILFSSKDIL